MYAATGCPQAGRSLTRCSALCQERRAALEVHWAVRIFALVVRVIWTSCSPRPQVDLFGYPTPKRIDLIRCLTIGLVLTYAQPQLR